MKTLYVHVGTPKTGSTAIQEFCSINRRVLESKDYCYPESLETYEGYSKRRNGMFLQRSIHRDGEGQAEEEKCFQENISKIIPLFKIYDNVILSNEGIWRVGAQKGSPLWKRLKEIGDRHQFAVKVIVYLRRQDVYVDSRWKQQIKGNGLRDPRTSISWDTYINDIPVAFRLDYYTVLKRISAVLGKENVIVRRYDRNDFPGGMIQADFLQTIGLELTDEYQIICDTTNESLSGNTCEIKRVVNTITDISTEESLFFRSILLGYSKESEENYPTSMFSVSEAKEFMELYQEGNRKIAAEYLGMPDEDLFAPDFKNVPKWEKDNPYMMEDVIRFIVEVNIAVLGRVKEENRALREEIKGLKQKLKHPLRTAVNMLGNAFTCKSNVSV